MMKNRFITNIDEENKDTNICREMRWKIERIKFILTIENKDDEYIFTKAMEDENDEKIDKNRKKSI